MLENFQWGVVTHVYSIRDAKKYAHNSVRDSETIPKNKNKQTNTKISISIQLTHTHTKRTLFISKISNPAKIASVSYKNQPSSQLMTNQKDSILFPCAPTHPSFHCCVTKNFSPKPPLPSFPTLGLNNWLSTFIELFGSDCIQAITV